MLIWLKPDKNERDTQTKQHCLGNFLVIKTYNSIFRQNRIETPKSRKPSQLSRNRINKHFQVTFQESFSIQS